ncbi:MAG TPA: deaminase [Bdellovibrionales bacterium]|nr:MAG: deaminase [Bdellovibrionales bacterium GWB1_52_6]OFZ03132.1 MAG: deaminase [Bdellovibrionales bacterium GWA1_52_35]OFZ43304.1 MAG: deaminase [Bdellovibrionales bacterium GWC1_52_8]HAR41261.1 deaminase [Bdellovibrionales bacterium]HCM40397.1 deaminase [Bdellovibrionales bacterium]
MKTIYFAASSLDGFISDKNNSLEWLFQFGEPKGNYIENFVNTVGALAMGSTTYEWMCNSLPGFGDGKWPYRVPAFVFTNRELPVYSGADIRFVKGDVRPVHQMMAAEAKDKHIWIVGGGELAGKFYDAHLLDEFIIQFVSVTLGGGAPLFPRKLKKPLKLESVQRLDQEFAELRYSV